MLEHVVDGGFHCIFELVSLAARDRDRSENLGDVGRGGRSPRCEAAGDHHDQSSNATHRAWPPSQERYECARIFPALRRGPGEPAGVPLPVVPTLVAAGALSAHTGAGMVLSILLTVVAALVADAIWYGLGRWRGREALRSMARLLRRSAEWVDSAEERFRDHQFAFLSAADSFPN